jgi:hypothetical protein
MEKSRYVLDLLNLGPYITHAVFCKTGKEEAMILIEQPKCLPSNSSLQCFSCKTRPASHVCRFKFEEVTVQACLCLDCMELENALLCENVLGYRDRRNYPEWDVVWAA